MMSKSRENSKTSDKQEKQTRVERDPRTGLLVLSGPKFTKEDVARDFPEDPNDRVATIMRRSVGL